jgi:transcriptional regulator with XRE-family HTH domain
MATVTFGEFFKAKRLAAGYTLRRFCAEFGFDPGNISKMERGILAPSPSNIEEYARCLKIKKGSDEWQEFVDLAAASQGRIPPDIMGDEELVAKLPLVFRTLRNERPTEAQLDELIAIVRKAHKA